MRRRRRSHCPRRKLTVRSVDTLGCIVDAKPPRGVHAVGLASVKLHLRHKRTTRQTDSRTNGQTQESNLVHFCLKVWHLVARILMIFLVINWPNFVYLLVDFGFLPLPLNICALFPYRMDAPSRHNRQSDKQTNETTDKKTNGSVFLSFRWSLTLTVGL